MMYLDQKSLAALAVIALVVYVVAGVVHRLFLSPLARFPGPKIVAATRWPEFYYDVIKGGTYIWEVEKMHEKYGPIVRVSPTELHINDPAFYHTIYAPAPAKRDKYGWWTKSPDSDTATGFTIEHGLHRLRREATAPFFNKRNTTLLEPQIKKCIEQLCGRLQQLAGTQTPVNLTNASLALTMDILTEYCFGQAFGLLEEPDFNVAWKNTILGIMKALPIVRNFFWLTPMLGLLPDSVVAVIAADMSQLNGWKIKIQRQVEEVLERRGKYAETKPEEKQSLFEELRDTDKLPAQEKTASRLPDEGSILLIAGSETPAKSLALALFHLLDNPAKLQRLRTELAAVISDPKQSLPALNSLEKLPFLTACLLESLRLHNGVVGRSPRCSPTPLTYYGSDGEDWCIPADTPVSMQSPMMHFNREIFPEPRQFRPERWLTRGNKHQLVIDNALKKYLVAFGAGTRSCLGYNLGMAMLYYGVAAMATRFDYELFETTFSDVDLQFDWMIPQPKVDTEGVRVFVTNIKGQPV